MRGQSSDGHSQELKPAVNYVSLPLVLLFLRGLEITTNARVPYILRAQDKQHKLSSSVKIFSV
jgi:hypothetical protein